MLRTMISIINIAITTTISLILLCVFGLINPYSNACKRIFYTWSAIALKLAGVKIEITGKENIDPSRGYVLCSNHLHLFDIPVLCVASKLNIRFAAKKELFKVPIFGQTLSLIGMVKIDRGNTGKALKALQQAEAAIGEHKIALSIFAEGTRNRSGKGLLPFKKGAFMMALNTKQAMLPVTLNGTNKVLHGMSLKPRTVHVHFHKPIEPETYTLETRQQFMSDVREIIESKLEDK